MGSTDDAGEVLATESPVHDVHGTEEKAIDKNTLEQNDETNDIKVAPLASGEEGAVSSKEMEETQQTCDGEDELDATKAEGDTVDSSRNKAIDGSEEECPIEGGMGGKGTADGLGVLNDGICTLIRATALDTINAARESHQLRSLSLDAALVVPATTHCRVMCEHGFLSHWDIIGRKPYQRYSDFAYGQHVSEVVFGFTLSHRTEDEILMLVKGCIEKRAVEDKIEDGGSSNTHLLDDVHTHIGIGVFMMEDQLRYVEVYADRYMELFDVPAELSVATADSGFQISVQMTSLDMGPYACLVFYDPVPTPLTVEELQQQFSGPYSDFTATQIGVVWPWQMELLDDGVVDIPIPSAPDEPGTLYVQVLVCNDPNSVPYDAEPAGGLPLPGNSFCGGAFVLKAPDETAGNLGIFELAGDGSLPDGSIDTLEEKGARIMASTTARRRDLAPIVRVRVVQELGAIRLQDDGYEQAIFMPAERSEDMAQLNLGVQFLRLGVWDDASSRVRSSEQSSIAGGSISGKASEGEAGEIEALKAKGTTSEDPDDVELKVEGPPESTEHTIDSDGVKATDSTDDNEEEKATEKTGTEGKAGEAVDKMDLVAPGDGRATKGDGREGGGVTKANETVPTRESGVNDGPPLVVTEIVVVTFSEGEQIKPPDGFELIPDDLANPEPSTSHSFSGGGRGDQTEREVAEGKVSDEVVEGDGDNTRQNPTSSGHRVFLCIKRVPYTDNISPLTDLTLVYGTGGFQLGFGFVTKAMPQAVNELYGCVVHLCHKKAGASLAVIQQMAERIAEITAKQIERHLSIEGDRGQDNDTAGEDEAYDVDTSMTHAQMLEWEQKRNREAEERADKREQVERDRKRQEASEAVQRRISDALREKEELFKTNAEWQKKVAALMLTQQKTREEARTEHGGRGVEKEAIPVHESEKHYAECLATIINCRERLQEQQAEYDTVAIALQTRLDEKEYKSREIAESFRDFKREIARTAEHSRTGKAIPKGVISQFEFAEAKKDEEIEKVRLKNINLRMMLKKVESNLRAKEQLAEGLHLIDFEQLKIENQTVNEKIEERNEELLKLRKKNTSTVQILTHTKEKLQFVAAENAVTSQQLSGLEDDLNGERDCLTRAKKERDALRTEVASLRQSQGFANSDLLILDFEQRKLHLKKLGQKLDGMRSKHHLLILEQERLQENNRQHIDELAGIPWSTI